MECSLRLHDFLLLLNHARRSTDYVVTERHSPDQEVNSTCWSRQWYPEPCSCRSTSSSRKDSWVLRVVVITHLQEYLQHISLRHPSTASPLNSDND